MMTIEDFIAMLKNYPGDAEVKVGVIYPGIGYVFDTTLPEFYINYKDYDTPDNFNVGLCGRKILYIGGIK